MYKDNAEKNVKVGITFLLSFMLLEQCLHYTKVLLNILSIQNDASAPILNTTFEYSLKKIYGINCRKQFFTATFKSSALLNSYLRRLFFYINLCLSLQVINVYEGKWVKHWSQEFFKGITNVWINENSLKFDNVYGSLCNLLKILFYFFPIYLFCFIELKIFIKL